jgi:two-component system, chemotaxis family, chemotaxis protein CheY
MAKLILVIDDDVTIVDIMQLALKSGGYDIESAYNARDGMAKACSNTPDLILLDYNMPGKDGLTLLQDMRSIPELVKVPIIIVTALSIPEIVSQALAMGVAGFLVKPFDLDTLLKHVKKGLDSIETDADPTQEETLQ